MTDPEDEDLIQRFMDPGHTYTYRECSQLGHFWGERGLEWFHWGWRLPWVRRSQFIRCSGCGIFQLVSGTRLWVWPRFRE